MVRPHAQTSTPSLSSPGHIVFHTDVPDSDNDPWASFLSPPTNETREERSERLARERHAKEVSDEIDEEIEKERELEKKAPKVFRILLLGQSESGKSTTLKNFQLLYDPEAFRAQRPWWRIVILFNIIQSFRKILEAISRAEKQGQGPKTLSPSQTTDTNTNISPDILAIKSRLEFLVELEKKLARQLTSTTDGDDTIVSNDVDGGVVSSTNTTEVSVNSTLFWKGAMNKLIKTLNRSAFPDGHVEIDFDDPEDPGHAIQPHSRDMIQLWNNPVVQELLLKEKVYPEQSSGFFLDSLDRVTGARFVPTDDDILRARLKTLGVSAHRFRIGSSRDLVVFDVGGHRSQASSSVNQEFFRFAYHSAWVPYFEDLDAIIFLVPVSCFNEYLEEDRKENRLRDSFKIWTSIVTNQLLERVNLVLFLNKIDILRTKLASDKMFKEFVLSYGDRPNDVNNVISYLKRKFSGILQEKSPLSRPFYCHLTTVIHRESTMKILSHLKEFLLRKNFKDMELIQ